MSAVLADDIYLNPTDSINETIINSNSGDTIYLNEGVYNQSGILVNKELTIVGNGKAENVIIDGNHSQVLVKVRGYVKVTFLNITFLNGYKPFNEVGGAIDIRSCYVTIDNCRFINNTAMFNGGAVSNGANTLHPGHLLLKNSIFIGNSAGHDGGAVSTYFSESDIINCQFYNNTADRDGGAIRVKYSTHHLLENCTFMYNQARGGIGWGGAIYTWSDVDSFIRNCLIANNYADEAGGAITSASRLVVTNCTIVNNSARYMGGGIYIFEEGEEVYSTAVFNYNNIYDNRILIKQYYYCEGDDVYIHKYVTEGNLLNFNDNYWGTNNPLNSTDYPYTWAERFYTSNKTVVLNSWLVKNAKSRLFAENIVSYYKSNSTYSVKLIGIDDIGLANMILTISINGENYTRTTNENGDAFVKINLDPGNYVVVATFNGGDGYEASNTSSNIGVLSTIEGSDVLKYFRNGTQFMARILNGSGECVSNKTVEMNINGVIYRRTSNENGSFSLPINLNPGNYILTVLNPVDGLCRSFNVSVLSLIEGENLTKFYKNDSGYVVKLLDKQGNAVSGEVVYFNINGIIYNRTTSSEGIASLAINLNPGRYVVTAFFNDSAISNVIDVLSVIESANLEMTSDARVPFVATVLNGQGKPLSGGSLSFNINGMIYDRISDVNGTASLDINLVAGKYIITTLFNGLFQSNQITIV